MDKPTANESLRLALDVDADLEMRATTLEQASALFHLVDDNRQHLRLFLSWIEATQTPADSRRYLQHVLELQRQEQVIRDFDIWHQGLFVGKIGLHTIDIDTQSSSIGYWLAKDHQGLGIITRCGHKLLAYAFDTLDLNRLTIECHIENRASQRIAHKLGFTQESIRRQEQLLYSQLVDLTIYSLTKSEYRVVR